MIKKYILSLLLPACCFCINLVTAQTWQWGVSGGSFESVQSDEKVETLKTDSNGNVYLLSPVGVNGLQVDGVPKEAFNNKDYMIASLSCSGSYRWSRVIGGGGSDVVNNMQLDANNNVYAAGLVYRTSATTQVHFGAEATGVYDTILPYSASNINTNKQKLFLVKYNSDGEMQWLRMPEAANVAAADNSQTRTYDVQTDPQGNSYWLVSIPPGTYANGAFVNTTQGFNLFIFKYDTDGNFVSASTIDMQLQDYSPFFKMVRNHSTGTIYIGGYLDVGAAPVINGAAITTPMYLAAFNGDGSFLWKVGNTGANGGISNLCLDNEGNVYIIGTTGNGDSFAGAQFTSAYVSGFPFIVKLTAGGQLLWATNAQTDNSNTAAGGIAINGNEVAITCGYGILHWGDAVLEQAPNEGYDVMLGRFNKADGSLIGLTDIEGNFGYWDYGTALAADPFGNYYVGGKFDSFLYVTDDDTLVDGAQGTDFFVAKYGTANCDCAPPTANFGAVPGTENTLAFTFTYTGETYDTIGWDFGDGGTSAEANPVHTYNTAGAYTVCVTVANACGTAEYCMAIEATLGVNSYQLAQVQTYPNPVKDVLSITTDQDLTYSLYSVLGTQVAGGTIAAGTSQLQLEEFASGIYTLTLKNSLGEQKIIKVVKE